MRFSTLVGAYLVVASVLASPIETADRQLHEVGHVTDADGKGYQLTDTGVPNIRVITSDRKDGYYIRPVSCHVEPDHVCKFYSESTRGIGYLIGEYKGPVDADFGIHWAAFYECWEVDLKACDAAITSCGWVGARGSDAKAPLNGDGETPFILDGQKFTPVRYHVDDHCQCYFLVQNGRGGPAAGLTVKGPDNDSFGMLQPYAYNCTFTL
ncbi:hypothetical protein BDW02DRAFT_595745 [Decorospora gaudefroyi]|uniref:Uncharacterized protein n=1 Tax=Decorospora gaudefroyi TaxID=184978 RepID=A0A6A5KN19_9PLEO|nr:hypothetical protein BDW02DRAFT_595745 [Decorospora gaudefroyi]